MDHVPRRAVYHCELAWLGGDTPSADVTVEVDDDRIVTVTPATPRPPGSVRLAGLTLPGLANAHSHAFHRALRGRTHDGTGSFWTWREQMYGIAAHLDPDTYGDLARAVFAEMALAGITCAGEFHYLHHDPLGRAYADPNAMARALVQAAGEAGIRLTLLDTCYLRGGIDRDLDPVQRRFADASVGAWQRRVDGLGSLAAPTVRFGAAVHSVRAVDPESVGAIASWADARGWPLHCHVSEQPAENHDCLEAYALTPTELLSERGALGPRFTAVHATHLTDHDVHLLGREGATVCLCPTTERDLADGIGPAARLAAAGAVLALGTDSHAMIDLLEEARAIEVDERLASQVRGTHEVTSLLAAATAHGHRSLGWPDAGRIAPGALADLVSVRLDSVRTAGTSREHALASVLFAASAADVHHVVTGGRVVVRDGQHTTIDAAGELDRAVRRAWGER